MCEKNLLGTIIYIFILKNIYKRQMNPVILNNDLEQSPQAEIIENIKEETETPEVIEKVPIQVINKSI